MSFFKSIWGSLGSRLTSSAEGMFCGLQNFIAFYQRGGGEQIMTESSFLGELIL